MPELKAILIQHPSPRTAFSVPLGLGYLASMLKAKGVSTKIIDATAPYAEYDNEKIARIVAEGRFDIIGVTITTLFAAHAYDLINILSKTNALIIAGGPHVSLLPDEPLKHGAHISVKGEGEITISEIVDHLNGIKGLSEILGISFIDNHGTIIDNAPRALIDRLDDIPFPDKGAYIADDYIKNKNDLSTFGNILTSRGCPANCTYCSKAVFGRKYRCRSPVNIIDEIKHLNKKYSITHFSFIDDAFAINAKRILAFCDLVKEKIDFGLTWSCINRVDCVTSELLLKMREAGCTHVNYGIESGNPETLRKTNKDISIDKIESALSRTNESSIEFSLNFMWGYPWESAQDIETSLEFVKRISDGAAWLNTGGILVPFPGTEIYETYKKQYGFENWWLDRYKFTGQYRLRMKGPLFRYYFFDDQGLLEGNGYFNYSEQIMRSIKKAVSFIGNFNLKRQPKLFYMFGSLFVCLSQISYKLSYRLELLLQKIFFLLLNIKKRVLKGVK